MFPIVPIPSSLRGQTVGLLLVLCLAMAATPGHAWQAKKDTKRQIEQLEMQWRIAQLSGDIVTMDHMLADDYVGITLTGQVTTKAQQLARLKSHTVTLTRLDLQDMKIKLVGQVAIVTVKAKVEGTGAVASLNGDYHYTRIYHQIATGAWKITNFEAIRVPTGRHRGMHFYPASGQAG